MTISWISQMPDGERNVAGIVGLMQATGERFSAIRELVGGVITRPSSSSLDLIPLGSVPAPRHVVLTEADLNRVVSVVGPVIASSTFACPRRFALQWMLGPSPAFQSPHQHGMLYGNMPAALTDATGLKVGDVDDLVEDLWRQFSRGQRASSRANRVVLGGRRGANPEWIFTLRGKRNGSSRIDMAYAAARGALEVDPNLLRAEQDSYLPDHPPTSEQCTMCPVKDRCAVYPLLEPPD